jgi:hypothetical protein
MYPGALLPDIHELRVPALARGKTTAEIVQAHHAPVGAAKAYLLQITATAGGNYQTIQFPLCSLSSNPLCSLFAARLGYLVHAEYARNP